MRTLVITLAALGWQAAGLAQEGHVHVQISTLHTRAPASFTQTLDAACGQRTFVLSRSASAATPDQRHTQLTIHDGSAQRQFDITDTPLGQALARTPTLGEFSLGCGNGLYVRYWLPRQGPTDAPNPTPNALYRIAEDGSVSLHPEPGVTFTPLQPRSGG
ncbi:MAG: hypothetical protein K9J82_07380 [Methylotenera sp.]|jgi:hypothetical protein|uniref:hypothetical protein n=1 Tax=Roseateles puraquae TaxID=431059 RepID=UPI0031E15BEF|nr:hypothetical protein [Methylotenera sp.]